VVTAAICFGQDLLSRGKQKSRESFQTCWSFFSLRGFVKSTLSDACNQCQGIELPLVEFPSTEIIRIVLP